MLRVTVEIIPHGIGEEKTIQTVFIANVGTDENNVANYAVWEGLDPREVNEKPHGKIIGHKRGQKNGLLVLLAKAFSALVDKKEKYNVPL